MWHFVYHYIYTDIWLPVWPNWFAAVPVSIYGVIRVKAWDKRRVKREEERHQELKAHITKTHRSKK